MNKRIQELAKQLGPVATIGNWGRVEWADNIYPQLGDRMYAAIDLEEFAELIVRECCRALNPMLRDMISRGQGREIILQHFGFNPREITTAMLDAAITQCEQELAKKKAGVEE
jgi:hypothetical protein